MDLSIMLNMLTKTGGDMLQLHITGGLFWFYHTSASSIFDAQPGKSFLTSMLPGFWSWNPWRDSQIFEVRFSRTWTTWVVMGSRKWLTTLIIFRHSVPHFLGNAVSLCVGAGGVCPLALLCILFWLTKSLKWISTRLARHKTWMEVIIKSIDRNNI